MKKIMFLCHGNICRSPMAEYVMKDLISKAGLENQFEISSGAVSDEEWLNPIYPPAQRKLREKGISLTGELYTVEGLKDAILKALAQKK